MARTAAARARAGYRWQVTGAVRDAVADADLVALAVPLPAVGTVLDELAGAGYSGLVTDVTSVKGPVGALVRRSGLLAGYVGGHPMAGRETSGFAAADGDLFRDCAWVLCLEPGETDLSDWLTLAQVVTGLGARVVPAAAIRAGWPPQPSEPATLPAKTDVLLRLGRAGGWITEVAPDRLTVTAARPA